MARRSKYFEKALPILRQAGAQEDEANALAGLGGAYTMLSRFDKAVEILEQALTLARQTKNRQAEGAILNNLGQTYEGLGKYDKAASTLNEALAIKREIKDRPGESACLSNLGAVFMDLGQFSEAAKAVRGGFGDISRPQRSRGRGQWTRRPWSCFGCSGRIPEGDRIS